jgi:CheY-like chemotaxis protein
VNRASILVVEDNPTARKMFRVTLEAEGYRVLEACDGRAALEHLHRELPGLVLQDLVLPDHDGIELARAIRALPGCVELPLIVMSGFPRLLDRTRTETTWFDASLIKPVPPSVLVDLVRSYLPAPLVPPERAGGTGAMDGFGRGKSILIVDDDPVQLKLARLRFADAGFEVATAGDSATALALAQAGPPDVVLCDVLMPGTDGYELCMALRRRPELSEVPVVLVSAHYGGSRDEALARAAGASALVTRTPLLEETLQAVRASLVDRSTPTPEDGAFRERHQASVIAQLERQVHAHAGVAERSALQSAQLSVLAGIADALARSEDINSALADVLAACLDAGGVTRGALFRVDANDRQALSTTVGFPTNAVALVESVFGFPAVLDHDDRGLVTPHDVLTPDDARTFLARAGISVGVIVPVMEGGHRLGALFLGTDVPGVDDHALATFGRAIAAHIAQALALTGAFTRLRDSATASRILSSSLEVGTTLSSLGDLATRSLAQLCEIRIGDDAPVVHWAQTLPADVAATVAQLAVRYPRCPLVPTDATAAPGKRSVLVPAMTEALLRPISADDGHLALLRALRIGAHLIVPLVAGDHHLGTVSFARLQGTRGFCDADVDAAEDLVQRAAMAIDNARLYASARDANRVKDEFLATVSHELRSPLNAILGWAQMLREGLPEPKREKAIATIERNAFTQAALIDDLLDVSRMISGTLRLELGSVRLRPIVEAAIEALTPQREAKSIRLGGVRLTSQSSLMGDASRLQQIVSNLLGNAIKFTPAGGMIELELADAGEHIRLTVRDDGKGIDPAFLPHVFDRFQQADSSSSRTHSGLGLGLAIARHLAELHGGTIAAASDGLGRGASFTLTLPRTTVIAMKPQAERADPGVSGHAGKLRGMAILVIDDEPDAREMLVSLLQVCGASVAEASSAAEALGLLARVRPDVLLSDLGMPGEDGFSLIRKVRALPDAEGGSTPAIAVSGYASSEDRKHALTAGFQVHLAKPVSVTTLIAVIRTLSRAASVAK